MQRSTVAAERAPKAIGPYSQAIIAGDFVFCAGQVAIDPALGKLIDGDIAMQTRQVLTNLAAVLEAAGSSLDQVVKTTVYLLNMGDFSAMNSIYAEFFPTEPPARATIQAAALPLGAQVEIEAIAIRRAGGEAAMNRAPTTATPAI
jgi:2-iminobutanoate/2-iminopropanoate deaminase